MINAIILGTGCTKCRMIMSNIFRASRQCGVDVKVTKSHSAGDYQKYKVRMVPGVIINGKLVSSGRVPSVEELTEEFRSHFDKDDSI